MQDNQTSQIDLILVLTATLCIVTLNLPFFMLDQNIKNLFTILLLFIPGYVSLVLIFPINSFKRISKFLFSFLISIGILMVILIFDNILSGFIITGSNLIILLSAITLVLVVFAFIRRKMSSNITEKDKKMIICLKCGGYYKLLEGESLGDFGSCNCGGELEYAEPNYQPLETEKLLEKSGKEKKVSKSRYLPFDLILILLISILSLGVLSIPPLNDSFILTILGLLFILFLPGYTLTAALFPKMEDLEGIERAALSFGLSVLIAPIFGIILNYTPLGIKLAPILLLLSIFTILMSIIAFIRIYKVNEKERFIFRFKGFFSK
jgi:uncharacterized membrane protein